MARTLTDDDLSRAFGELGILPTTDMPAILDAYKTRALIVHPDRAPSRGREPFQRLQAARENLMAATEDGTLKAYVARVTVAWDTDGETSGTVYGVPRKVEDAFPNMRDIIIVHRVAPNMYVLWASKSIVANNVNSRTVCRLLREMAGDAADAPDALVWVFVPGVQKTMVQLRALPAMLAQLDPTVQPTKKPAADAEREPESSRVSSDGADVAGSSLEEIKEEVLKQDWRGARSAYVIYVGATAARKPSARVVLVRKIGTSRRVDLIGTTDSSESAVTLLHGRGVNQDVTPVFVIHAANPGEVMRFGAA